MSQVQNTLLHNYVQPITVVAIAYIAGSKRFIQHFPGASQGGLCLGAVLGAIGALASPKLLRTKKDEPHFYSFSRIAACLSLGTLFAYASVKSLTGRLTLSLPASFNFIGVEIVAAGIFAGMSLLISKPQADEKKPHPISTERDKPKEPPTHTKDGKLLNKLGIDPVFRHIIPPLMRQTPAQIQALSRAQIQGIHTFTGHYYIKNLTYPQQRTFSERFTSYNLNPKTLQNTDDGSERKSID